MNWNEKGEVMVVMSAKIHPWEIVRRLKFWNAEKFWSLLLMQVFRIGY